ncbi:MAG: clostripain-related cysteine peptidase [Candidatus Thermoplasmatota archaeon]|nr:clostripain-related cysteine peptidase [Candidatus Thermoplasmatota archaeon]
MAKTLKWIGMAISVIFIITIFWFSIGVSSDYLSEVFPPNEHKFTEKSLTTVEITKPMEGHLYMFDRDIAPIGITLVAGGITIEVETSEDIDGIDIYIDDELKFSDYTHPYSRVWNEKVMGRHVIKAAAHGGNESDEVSVLIFNFPKSRPDAAINEIMSDPAGEDAGNEWIELYNAGESIRIKGWTIGTSDGIAVATLPNWVFPNNTYLVIRFGTGANDEDFSDGNGTFYTGTNQDFFDNDMDECALYEGKPGTNTIVDFISYCYEGNYTPGVAHDYATKARIWNENEYFDPMAEPTPPGTKPPSWTEGDSIGRDSYSNDTNTPEDWDITGGKDAFEASPGRCNLDAFGIVSMEMPLQLEAPAQGKKWTVMVYLAADNGPDPGDLEDALFEQLNELEKIGSDDNINIVFQIDGWNKTNEVYMIDGKWEGHRNKGKTFRGFLMKDNNREIVNWGRTRINTSSLVWAYNPPGETAYIGEKNTGKAAPLREFINWSIKHAPADRYILILNGHGAGWKGLLPDYTSRDMLSNMDDYLYMGELESALFQSAIRNVPAFSIIGFDCCLMANIEVAYQIRDWALYMVASEEVAKNWNYEDVFGHLQKNPDISRSDLAKYMVDSYHTRHKDWKCHTLSAIDLGRLSGIYGGVHSLSIHLKEGMEDWGDTKDQPFDENGDPGDNCQMNVKSCLLSAEHYSDRNYIDLYHFVHLLGHNDGIYTGYKKP